ncbi:MAG: carboxypeptidase regulatory-like domain-containing protein, partial [Chitinophagaceae bacterium]|nr:carboxypeptidase regulatory-like domain-containing protein [Chitinophagaceae bacterium]
MLTIKGFAQHTISGGVADKQAAPLAFANIILTSSSDSLFKKGVVSDSAGNFRFNNLHAGNYKLTASLINYLNYSARFNLSADTSIFVQLNDTLQDLNAIVITSRKPVFEKTADRFVFNVANSPLTTGGAAWDVLQHTPMLMVNNTSVSIIGSSGATVYINDRKSVLSGEDLARYLQAMPADNIIKIEVITAPSAKYEAGTGGGIINIVLKKILDDGLNGSLTLGDRQATYNNQNGSLQLNYRHNRYSQSFTASTGLGKQHFGFDNIITYTNPQQQERLI